MDHLERITLHCDATECVEEIDLPSGLTHDQVLDQLIVGGWGWVVDTSQPGVVWYYCATHDE
jgi:hypothetical protein